MTKKEEFEKHCECHFATAWNVVDKELRDVSMRKVYEWITDNFTPNAPLLDKLPHERVVIKAAPQAVLLAEELEKAFVWFDVHKDEIQTSEADYRTVVEYYLKFRDSKQSL